MMLGSSTGLPRVTTLLPRGRTRSPPMGLTVPIQLLLGRRPLRLWWASCTSFRAGSLDLRPILLQLTFLLAAFLVLVKVRFSRLLLHRTRWWRRQAPANACSLGCRSTFRSSSLCCPSRFSTLEAGRDGPQAAYSLNGVQHQIVSCRPQGFGMPACSKILAQTLVSRTPKAPRVTL